MNTSPHPEKSINRARTLFLVFCSSFIIGDIIGCLGHIPSLLFFVGTLSILSFSRVYYRPTFLIALLAVSLGYSLGQQAVIAQERKYTTLKNITHNFTLKWDIIGSVDALLFRKERTTVYRVYIDNFATFAKWESKNSLTQYRKEEISTTIFVEIPSNLQIINGDKIAFSGKIENNLTFPLRGFSRYAYFQWWFGSIFVPSFSRMSRGNIWYIDRIKSLWTGIFERYFPTDVAGTLLGMTIGSIDLLSREVKNAFINTGISHILVVSGSNIAFLIITIIFFLKYTPLGKYARGSIVLSFLLFYGSLVGWDVSVVRATLMGVLSYAIVEYGGNGSSRAWLALAGLILTIYNPLAPLYDAGFGLSFCATLGILLFHTPIEKWCKKYNFPHASISLISVSIGAMLGSLPMVVYHFERIPLATLVTNLLIGWLLGWILFSCVLFIGIQWISSSLAIILGLFIYLPAKAIILLATFFQYGWVIEISSHTASLIALFFLWIFTFLFIENVWRKHH